MRGYQQMGNPAGIARVMLLLVVIMIFGDGSLFCVSAQAAGGGELIGTVVDAETGEPLVGVTVMIENTTIGAKSDLEGYFRIKNILPGIHTFVFSSIGYTSSRVENVEIGKKEIKGIDMILKQEVLTGQKEITVRASAIKGTEAALLRERQKAITVSDAISATTIARAGSGDAADAIKQITGASVVGGKYVYVRGLGGRYSNTQLNGAPLPSADPDKYAVSMDLVPAKLLDKVVVRKTFTPDQQGNFSGGSVDIGTKSLPDKLTFTFSQSTGYNERATFNDDFLSFRTSEAFWRASNNGSLDIPRALSDPETEIPDYGAAQKDIESAMLLDYYSTAFNNEMAPITKKAPVNHNYSFSFGNRYSLFEHPVGILASLTYSHKTSFYDDGTVNRWVLSGSSAEELTREYNWNDTRGEEDVLWGGLAELNYQPHANHQVGITFIYNRNANASARYLTGPWPEQVGRYTFETRVLHYVERELNSLQIKGENYIGTGFPLRVEWIGSISSTSKDEPDLRYFSNQYRLVGNPKASPDNPDEPDSIYAYRINKSSYTLPTRYYRYMEEDNKSFKVDFSYPFRQWSSLQGKFGFGALYTRTTREMREQRFVYDQRRPNVYSGDPESFFGPEYTGLTDSVAKGTYTRYVFDNYIKNEYQPSNNYDGEQDMFAFYVMAQLPLTRRLQSVFGVRREKTDMEVINFVDSSGTLNDRDLLPSFSLVYKLTDKMNVRSAYGRTLARPNFREKAPFRAFEFVGDYIFNGNIYLERTLIDNYDLRWEYFADPGEIFAVSAYYKDFHQPIERVIINHNGEVTYRNVDQAVVYGLEFEARTNLSRFWSLLGNLSLGGNFSLIHSSVTISDEEREVLEDYGLLDEERPLQGQSPYLINIDLYYENRSSGTSATLLYNVFGKRLYEVSLGGTPNVYEQPTQILDLTFSQAIIGKLKFGLSVKNLLNSTARMTQEWDGLEYTTYEYRLGRTFSVGTSFSL